MLVAQMPCQTEENLRINDSFVIQGGGFRPTSLTTTDINEIQGPFNSATGDFEHHIPTFDPIPDERDAESMSNVFGTYAMAKNSAGATSEFYFNFNDNSALDHQGFTVFAVDLDALNPDGTPNADATISLIHELARVDVDGPGGYSVFDNVPFTAQGEMVYIQSIHGSGTVTGTVFNDLDHNGVQKNVGEAGLAGVVIFSDENGNGTLDDGEFAAVTRADGSYSLVLPAGEHTIRRQNSYYVSATPSNPDSFTRNVEIGGEINEISFGVVKIATPLGSFASFVYVDANNDRVRNPEADAFNSTLQTTASASKLVAFAAPQPAAPLFDPIAIDEDDLSSIARRVAMVTENEDETLDQALASLGDA